MKAMILAAGLGKRMRPLTDHTPKPLLPVGGKPLIEYHLEKLAALGVREVVINIAYLGQAIRDAVGDGSRWGVNVHYSQEPEPLETAGAINLAFPLLGDEPFLLVNGDVWTDYPLTPLCHHELAEGALGHLLMVNNPEYREAGDFALEAGCVVAREADQVGLTFSGISLLHPALVSGYPDRRRRFALREVFDRAIAQGQLTGELYDGQWWDVGTPERLAQLDEQLLKQA